MSVSDEMFTWLETERVHRRLESIQETIRLLLSNHVSGTEVVLWREDDNVLITIPKLYVTDVVVNEPEKTMKFSGHVYGERGRKLLEDINKLRNDQALHKKCFSLVIPDTYEGIVRFIDKIPTAKRKEELVDFKFNMYLV